MEESKTDVDNVIEERPVTVAEQLSQDVMRSQQPITEHQFKQLRREHFTVRHDRVQPCDHRFDRITEPRTNCSTCWYAFFDTHENLVTSVDRAYREQGKKFVEKLRGNKFRVFFEKFMSTKFQLEQKLEQEKLKQEKLRNDERETREVEGDSDVREEIGQTI